MTAMREEVGVTILANLERLSREQFSGFIGINGLGPQRKAVRKVQGGGAGK